ALGIDGRLHTDESPFRAVRTDFGTPTIDWPQTLRATPLVKLAGDGGGVLLGLRRSEDGKRLWVLTDPDPLQNHGLHRGENLRFALALMDLVAPGATPVVVD